MQEIELSGSVGAGGANEYGDVLAVQAGPHGREFFRPIQSTP